MICNNCGREMPDTDRFCGICGAHNPLFESTQPSWDSAPMPEREYHDTVTDLPESEDIPETEQPNRDFASGIQSSVARVQEQSFTLPQGVPAPEYRPFDPNLMPPPPQKEKRTCSLSVVIFCGVLIFLLSIACGVLAGLYLNERAAHAPYSVSESDRR